MSEQHPQIKAFRDAAAAMKAERYWSYGAEDKVEFLRALSEVLTEVCYHLDKHQVLPLEAMEAYRSAAKVAVPAGFKTSAELILMLSMQQHIDEYNRNHRTELDEAYGFVDFDDPEIRRLANGGHDPLTDGPL